MVSKEKKNIRKADSVNYIKDPAVWPLTPLNPDGKTHKTFHKFGAPFYDI